MNVVDKELALEKLKNGLPIIFQTDTLPAIGCFPKFAEVIYAKKRRDRNKPLILMGAKVKELSDYVHESAKEDYENMASKYWPGALTIIIPVSSKNRLVATSKDSSLGLRIPNSHFAKSFLSETGPLLTSSANLSGIKGSTSAERISIDLPDVDILGPLPWEKCSGKASTIISWVSNGNWKLIRRGKVLVKELNS